MHVSKDQNSLQRIVYQNPSGRVHTIEFRHADVQNQQVRFELPALLHGLATIRSLTANLQPFMRSQQGTQSKAKHRMIISQQYAKNTHEEPPRTKPLKVRHFLVSEFWHPELQ